MYRCVVIHGACIQANTHYKCMSCGWQAAKAYYKGGQYAQSLKILEAKLDKWTSDHTLQGEMMTAPNLLVGSLLSCSHRHSAVLAVGSYFT